RGCRSTGSLARVPKMPLRPPRPPAIKPVPGVREWIGMTRWARCPRCDYDLSGVSAARCPECGRDLTDPVVERDASPRHDAFDEAVATGAVAILINLLT